MLSPERGQPRDRKAATKLSYQLLLLSHLPFPHTSNGARTTTEHKFLFLERLPLFQRISLSLRIQASPFDLRDSFTHASSYETGITVVSIIREAQNRRSVLLLLGQVHQTHKSIMVTFVVGKAVRWH